MGIYDNPREKAVFESLLRECETKQIRSSRDWIVKRAGKETPQTYTEFIWESNRNFVGDEGRSRIYLLSLDPEIPPAFFRDLQLFCSSFYHSTEVVVLDKSIDVPSKAEDLGISSRRRSDTKKMQFLSADILDMMEQEHLPDDAYCMLGLINADLYPRDKWNFVFGVSRITKRVGVFSISRYDPRFFDSECEIAKEELTKLVLYRACKTMVHEIGHMFGVRHCYFYECIMNGSNTLEEADLKPLFLCPVCLRKIKHCLEFDIKERYELLSQVVDGFDNPRFDRFAEWLSAALQLVEDPSRN